MCSSHECRLDTSLVSNPRDLNRTSCCSSINLCLEVPATFNPLCTYCDSKVTEAVVRWELYLRPMRKAATAAIVNLHRESQDTTPCDCRERRAPAHIAHCADHSCSIRLSTQRTQNNTPPEPQIILPQKAGCHGLRKSKVPQDNGQLAV